MLMLILEFRSNLLSISFDVLHSFFYSRALIRFDLNFVLMLGSLYLFKSYGLS
jgi:hypothetical protein